MKTFAKKEEKETKNMETFHVAAKILGGVILVLWVFSVYGARKTCRTQGSMAWATIFQFAILPIIVSLALLILTRA